MNFSSTTVSAAWLASHSDNCLILDCRATLGKPGQGREHYLLGHIPGAVYADIDQDMADPPDHRGRHPLPEKTRWVNTLAEWGLNQGQQVVLYDDAGGAFAARAWWMLLWVGHAHAAVLDGGWSAWQSTYPEAVTSELPATSPSNFQAAQSLVQIASTEQIQKSLAQQALPLIDARTEDRWAGRGDPIDPVSGHIPGARCLPFQENLNADGRFKSPAELAQRFAEYDPTEPLVHYCGSGVTATHNILAMHIAGKTNTLLYPESWSGWITDPTRPIETS